MNLHHRLAQRFQDPSAEFRSAPFWSWNDRLDPEELAWQIRDMKRHGIGGFFMHTREGLETEYLGPAFMACIRESVKVAGQEGMHAWLYDEDCWPSGTAGGLVPSLGDEYRCKGLTLEVSHAHYEHGDPRVVALFRAKVNGMRLESAERLDPRKSRKLAGDGEAHLVLRVEVSERSEWFNNESPPDHLNPDTVKAFIESTYEKYKQAVGDQFGKTIPGIFTDEPSVHDRHARFTPGRGWIPWTDTFPDFFRERRGYDLLDVVPHIYFHGDRSAAVRHDYWRTVAERFSEGYTRQLYEWCENNGLQLTGHFLNEHLLGVATRVCGAIMPNYRYQHVPGIDILTEQTDETITIKQCTSVARQFGRKRVISETYGCTGWDFTFEGQKWVGDFQYVLGVNMICQHLALYSLRGCRKRDYPPAFGYNTSWWKYHPIMEDYFARLAAVLTEGEAVRDLLVLHPASTAWTMLGTNPYGMEARSRDRDLPEVNEYGHAFNGFLRDLLGAHYDFDLGDETLMKDAGKVIGEKLYIQHAGYKAVVIPPMRSMFASTVRLLLEWMEAGGRIVAVRPLPTMVEGRPAAEELHALFHHDNMTIVSHTAEVPDALQAISPRRVSIRDARGIEAHELLYMLRETEEGYILFVVNNDRHRSIEATIDLPRDAVSAEEWDPLTGSIAAAVMQNGGYLKAVFGPVDSKLYMIRRREAGNASPRSKVGMPEHRRQSESGGQLVASLGPVSRYERTEPNALTLDRCSYRMHGGEWSEEKDVWVQQKEIRELLGMRPVHSNGILQRYKWVHQPHDNDGLPVEFRFRFEVSDVPEGDVSLAVECAEDFRIVLNGQRVDAGKEGWFRDKLFDRIKLPRLRRGSNELILACRYLNRMEIEDCYLIGDFGVDPQRRIVKEPDTLYFSDWCMQGLFHYSGSIVYRFDEVYCRMEPDDRMILNFGAFSAVTIEVRVNGQSAGHVPWKSRSRLDITPWMQDGANRIEVEVMGSPRNLLGPFHLTEGDGKVTSWASFRSEGVHYTPDYRVKAYGLFEPIRLYRTKG